MKNAERILAAVLTNTKICNIIQCFQYGKFWYLYSEKVLITIQKS